MEGKAVLISIRPQYANKIISGEKRLEFRRRWAVQEVQHLLIYSSSPVKRFVAIAEVKSISIASPTGLWALSKTIGGGISRKNLFEYLEGKTKAVAIELSQVQEICSSISPKKLLGRNFRPPQSFRYLEKDEFLQLKSKLVG